MKNHALIPILLVILVFTFGCKKDNASDNSPASYSVKVNGNAFAVSLMVAEYMPSGNLTAISAAASNKTDFISIQFIGSATGTYIINENNAGAVNMGNNSYMSIFSPIPVGQIVITKFDLANKLISGTFYFDAEDIDGNVSHVTEGKFENVELTQN